MYPRQANLHHSLLLLSSRLHFSPTTTFLGVIFNYTLSFSKHVSFLKAKFFPCLNALCFISASSWGPFKSLSLLYKLFFGPLLTYASPGWIPFLSITNITKLERLHRAASHAITSHFSFSPIPLLPSEASLALLQITLLISLFHLMSRLSVSQPPFPFKFSQTWSETKTLQIVLESFCIHSPAHASAPFFP